MGSTMQNEIFHADFSSFREKTAKYLISVGLNYLIIGMISCVHHQAS